MGSPKSRRIRSQFRAERKPSLSPTPNSTNSSAGPGVVRKAIWNRIALRVEASRRGGHRKLDSGEPAMMLNEMDKGRVVGLGFHLMKSTSPAVVSLAKGIVNRFKTDAGVTGPDPLGAKRAEWVAWRGERVTQLVRDISIAAKQKNPRLVISSSVVRHHGSSTLATATRAAGSPRESTIRYFL